MLSNLPKSTLTQPIAFDIVKKRFIYPVFVSFGKLQHATASRLNSEVKKYTTPFEQTMQKLDSVNNMKAKTPKTSRQYII